MSLNLWIKCSQPGSQKISDELNKLDKISKAKHEQNSRWNLGISNLLILPLHSVKPKKY